MHFICFVFIISGNFGIVEPFPDDIYPRLFSSAQVTCVAYDSAGVKIPEKILFMRKDQFAQYHELKPSVNLYFTNRTTGRDMRYIGDGNSK